MERKPPETPPHSAPDRNHLKRVQAKFEKLSRQRFLRLKSVLLPAQRHFLEMLPALLHCHHPVLPGYGKHPAPSGIHGYRLRPEINQLLERRFPGFKATDHRLQTTSIQGLYLMGSSGTLAQNIHSDLDCWVCMDHAPNQQDRVALQEKCSAISEWAKRLRLEVHFFIMHDESFRQKVRANMTIEDCGDTQHYLLLDEFYRTAIPLAGRHPLWWLMPCDNKLNRNLDQQQDFYQGFRKTLFTQRFIKQNNYLDFGDTGVIPIREYLSASVWTLFKAIQSPHKALIKLMLLESYIVDHGKKNNLSDQLKSFLHGESNELESLDPYLQIYQHIENYLQETDQSTRLDVLRRCFYRKVDIKVSRLGATLRAQIAENRQQSQLSLWRHQLLLELIEQWGWSNERIAHEDNIDKWPLAEQVRERRDIDRELIAIYRFLEHKAKEQLSKHDYNAHLNAPEMRLLERQLNIVFRHARHKVGYRVADIDTRLVKRSASNLFLAQRDLSEHHNGHINKSWALHTHSHPEKNTSPLYSARTLEQIIMWSILNGMASKQTVFLPVAAQRNTNRPHSFFNEIKRDKIVREIFNFVAEEFSSDYAIRELDAKAKITRCLVLINSQMKGDDNLLDRVVLSERDDPLSYTGVPHNMVRQLSMTWENNWGEIFQRQFEGHDAIQKAIYFFSTLDRDRYCQPTISCISSERSAAVARRIQQLFNDTVSWLDQANEATTKKPKGFVFATADGLYLVPENHSSGDRPKLPFWPAHSPVIQTLEQASQHWQIMLDPMSIGNTAVGLDARFTLGAKSLLG